MQHKTNLNNAALMARRQAAIPRGVGNSHAVFIAHGENAEIWDVEGKRYVDFAGGIAVLNTGHRHPAVVAAVKAQLDHYTHTCFQVLPYEPYVELAERINAKAPGNFAKKTLFLNTGAEAVENAIKIARAYTQRPGVIAFTSAYHGLTLLTLGLTGKVAPYKVGFGPFPNEIFHARFPDLRHGMRVDDSIEAIESIFKNDIEASRVAAFIVEPIQGEGGFNVAPTEFLQRLRILCDTHGILLITDETHPAKYSLPGLMRLLKALPPDKRPKLVRGDSAFGNDPVLTELESMGQMYLTKLRQTAGVKRLIERNWSRQDWQDVGQGSEAVEAQLKLAGWAHARRVVVVRSAPKAKPASVDGVTNKKEKRQKNFDFEDADPVKRWDYAVLVTNSSYELKAIGQLYRDRADCENGFDELKNQWGWGGYTTQDLERCNLSARAVALIYNWWSWYVRLAHPAPRLEAITSRPLLLAGVARLTEHAGQSRLLLTLTHAAGDLIKSMVANVRKGLDIIFTTAPQLTKRERWTALVRYIVEKIIATKPQKYVQPALMPSNFSQPLIPATG